MKARLTPEEQQAARDFYTRNPALSVAAVADTFGVGYTVMHAVLADVTRAAGGRPRTPMTTEEMIRLRDEGKTLAQVGELAGISESGVLRRIQRAGGKK